MTTGSKKRCQLPNLLKKSSTERFSCQMMLTRQTSQSHNSRLITIKRRTSKGNNLKQMNSSLMLMRMRMRIRTRL